MDAEQPPARQRSPGRRCPGLLSLVLLVLGELVLCLPELGDAINNRVRTWHANRPVGAVAQLGVVLRDVLGKPRRFRDIGTVHQVDGRSGDGAGECGMRTDGLAQYAS